MSDGFAGKKTKFLSNFLLPFAFGASYYFMKYLMSHDFTKTDCYYVEHITKHFPDRWEFQNKFEVILSGLVHTGLFVLLTVFSTMMGRLFTGRSGIGGGRNADNNYINACNRILKNTIEQSFIFFGIFSFWVFKVSGEQHSSEAVLLVTAFLVGRLIYYIGYLFSLISGIVAVRAIGFFINVIVLVHILIKIYGLEYKYKIYELF